MEKTKRSTFSKNHTCSWNPGKWLNGGVGDDGRAAERAVDVDRMTVTARDAVSAREMRQPDRASLGRTLSYWRKRRFDASRRAWLSDHAWKNCVFGARAPQVI